MRALLLTLWMSASALAQAPSPLRVLGSPPQFGPAAQQAEQSLVTLMREALGEQVRIEYRPVTRTGLPPGESLRALRAGLFELGFASPEASWTDAPALHAASLPALAADLEAARSISLRLAGAVAPELERRLGLRLLALVPLGRSRLFCREPLESLAALAGRSVLVSSETQHLLMQALGARPVASSSARQLQALREGQAACVLASPQAALGTGLTTLTPFALALPLQLEHASLLARADWLNRLPPPLLERLRAWRIGFVDERWAALPREEEQALACLQTPSCPQRAVGPRLQLQASTEVDAERLRERGGTALEADWRAACEQQQPGCAALLPAR